jgi:hypothetical protein
VPFIYRFDILATTITELLDLNYEKLTDRGTNNGGEFALKISKLIYQTKFLPLKVKPTYWLQV